MFHSPQLSSSSPTSKHSPKYKDFLFDGTVTLYVGPNRKRMEIHKNLLASISPELNKHVNNDMREGIEGIIYFPDEGEEALTLFTEWAYTGDYLHNDHTQPTTSNTQNNTTRNRMEPKQDPWPSLHKHLQLCVFSDKFNIPALKQLAESKFYTEIRPVHPNSEKDATGLAFIIGYAYDNLPSSDPILKFLAQYASWKLRLLRVNAEFNSLISTQPDFLKEFLMNLSGSETKPMVPDEYNDRFSGLFE